MRTTERRYPTRGFGSMDRAKVQQIAKLGGTAAHQKGVAHEWDEHEASIAGRKGGLASAAAKRRARLKVEGREP